MIDTADLPLPKAIPNPRTVAPMTLKVFGPDAERVFTISLTDDEGYTRSFFVKASEAVEQFGDALYRYKRADNGA